MAGGLLKRVGEIALKVESTEGTAETLAAADADLAIMDPAFSPNIEHNPREVVRQYLSNLAQVTGKRFGGISFGVEMKGSGSIATVPSWDEALRCAGFGRSTVERINIGAVTGGPFTPGEIITGGTSGATARVVGQVLTGAASIPYVVVSGVLVTAELLTGGTSGATATSSSGPTASQGFVWEPLSAAVPSCTVGFYNDGLRKLLVGCRSTFTAEMVNGGIAKFGFDFQGVYGGVTDLAVLGPTYETAIPEAFLSANLALQDAFSPHFTSLNVDMANDVQIRETANNANGGISAKIVDRDPSASIDPEATLVADHDWYGKVLSGATGHVHCEVGSTVGTRLIIAMPRVQYQSPSEGDRAGIQTLGLTLRMVSESINTGDDELQIAMI